MTRHFMSHESVGAAQKTILACENELAEKTILACENELNQRHFTQRMVMLSKFGIWIICLSRQLNCVL